MPGVPADPKQKLSKTLFGQLHRLAVMEAVATSPDGLINPTDLQERLGLSAQSKVQLPIRDLEEAGLLVRLPTQAGRTYYQRVPSKVWEWIVDTVQALEAEEARHR